MGINIDLYSKYVELLFHMLENPRMASSYICTYVKKRSTIESGQDLAQTDFRVTKQLLFHEKQHC